MTRAVSLLFGLVAGFSAGELSAQQLEPVTTPANPAPTTPAPSVPSSPGQLEFQGADGKPLPPAIQQKLREQFKANPPVVAPPADKDEVVVTGARPRGSVIGDIPPERTFDPLEIRAYGANSIEELLQALGPQVNSGRGRGDDRPVVLINGKRVSGFAEIAKIPPEAIQKMEVFPEELALKYGYPADQKVVNVVLFEKYDARIAQAAYGVPTEGGRDMWVAGAGYLRIRGHTRTNVDAEYNRSESLRESERDVVLVAGTPDQRQVRTLLPASERFVINGTISAPLLDGVLDPEWQDRSEREPQSAGGRDERAARPRHRYVDRAFGDCTQRGDREVVVVGHRQLRSHCYRHRDRHDWRAGRA